MKKERVNNPKELRPPIRGLIAATCGAGIAATLALGSIVETRTTLRIYDAVFGGSPEAGPIKNIKLVSREK